MPFSLRFEANTIHRPSGVHVGRTSSALSNVRRESVSRAQSYTQTSDWVPSEMSIARRVPSGEKLGELQSATVLRNGDTLPVASSQLMGAAKLAALPAR